MAAFYQTGDTLICDVHRKTVWMGHLECSEDDGGCGRTYKRAAAAPLMCHCGRRLLPVSGVPAEAGNQQFSGRPMCPRCFHESETIPGGEYGEDGLGFQPD
jgi:hypothetical protein